MTLAEGDGGGTDLTAVHEGLPEGVSAADNELGWRQSLARRARLVEDGVEPARVDFASTGGVVVAAYRWNPAGDPRAVVQLTHGGGEHALRYAHLARALNREGYVVYAQDHRGHGNTVASDTELGLLGAGGWAALVDDIDRLRLRARTEHPSIPLVLLGLVAWLDSRLPPAA